MPQTTDSQISPQRKMPSAVIDSSNWTDKFAVVGILWDEKKITAFFRGDGKIQSKRLWLPNGNVAE